MFSTPPPLVVLNVGDITIVVLIFIVFCNNNSNLAYRINHNLIQEIELFEDYFQMILMALILRVRYSLL